MTSPLHGEGRAFESPRAHCFFFDSEAEIVSDDEREQDKKLHNSEEELHNSGPGILTTDANGSQTTWAPNGVHTLNAEYIGDPSLPNASITVTKVTP